MTVDAEKRLQKRVLKLEKALLKLRKRRMAHSRKMRELADSPPGLVAEHTYGDRTLVPDEDEAAVVEIDQALMED